MSGVYPSELEPGAGDDRAKLSPVLIVHGLPSGLSSEGLRNQFLLHGDVLSAKVIVNKASNTMGFVEMRTMRDCAAAIANINNRAPLHWNVKLSEPPEVRASRRRNREEAEEFQEQIRPDVEAKIREFREHEAKLNELTQKFLQQLELDDHANSLVREEPEQEGWDSAGASGDAGAGNRQVFEPRQAGGAGGSADPAGNRLVFEPPGKASGAGKKVVFEPRLAGIRLLPCCVCGTPTGGHCQRCKARYCSKPCQMQDWPVHSVVCREPEVPSLVVTTAAAGKRPAPAAPAEDARSVSSGEDAGRYGDGGRARTQRGPAGGSSSPYRGREARGDPAVREAGQERLQPGSHPVVVSAIADPDTIYLRRRDTWSRAEQMEQGLAREAAVRPPGSWRPAVGDLCAAQFNGAWYRACVEYLSPDTTALRVFFVDWGNKATVKRQEVAPLAARHSQLPWQAVRVRLAWRPAGAGGLWSGQQLQCVAGLEMMPLTAKVSPPASPGADCTVALFNDDGKNVLTVMSERSPEARQAISRSSEPPTKLTPARPPAAVSDTSARPSPANTPAGKSTPASTPVGKFTPTSTPAGKFTPTSTPAGKFTPTGTPAGKFTTASTPAGKLTPANTPAGKFTPTSTPAGKPTPTVTPAGKSTPTPNTTPVAKPSPSITPAAKFTPTNTPAAKPTPASSPACTSADESSPASVPPAQSTSADVSPAQQDVPEPDQGVPVAPPSAAAAPAEPARLPNNLSSLLTEGSVMVIPSAQLDSRRLVAVLLNADTVDCCSELEELTAPPLAAARPGDLVVAEEQGTPSRALICSRAGPDTYHVLFLDTGTRAEVGRVRELPARWRLDRLPPMALLLEAGPDAPPDAVSRLIGVQESAISLTLPAGAALTQDTQQLDVTVAVDELSFSGRVFSCQHLLPDPDPEPHTQPVPAVQLTAGRRYLVVPTSMEQPQQLTAQLRQPDSGGLLERLQQWCSARRPPAAVPPVSSLLAVRRPAPDGWQRAQLLGQQAGQLQLRLLDSGLTVPAQLADCRLLDASFAQPPALGLQFGLADIAADVCPADELDFYRNKLIGTQFSLEPCGLQDGVLQARLHFQSDAGTGYCFNQKMLARLAKSTEAAAAAAASEAPARPAASALQTGAPAPAATASASVPVSAAAATVPAASVPASAAASVPASAAAAPAGAAAKALYPSDLPSLTLPQQQEVPVLVTDAVGHAVLFGTPMTEEALALVSSLEERTEEVVQRQCPPPCPAPLPDQLVLVQTPSDGWCRATVLEAVVSGPLHLWLLDLGRLQEAPAEQLRLLPPELAAWPALAVQLNLRGYQELAEPHQQTVLQTLSAPDALVSVLVLSADAPGEFTVSVPELDAQLRAAGANF